MGTDIHSIAQVRRNGSWETVAIGVCGDPRSYNTFAMLADVRNGRGFAGIKTSDGFPYIHEPRGLPADLKEPTRMSLVEVDSDDSDDEDDDNDDDNSVRVNKDHLVAAWDWDGNEVAIESEKASRVRYLKDDSSRMWLGDHSHSWCTLTELNTFVFAEWEKPALEASWLSEIVAALELVRTRCGVSADDVRFVYGFDS